MSKHIDLYDNSLIIRVAFGPNEFKYKEALKDKWTSKESASVIAKKLSILFLHDIKGIIHVGGTRKTILNFAHSLGSNDVKEISLKDIKFKIPKDTSLNCKLFNKILKNYENS